MAFPARLEPTWGLLARHFYESKGSVPSSDQQPSKVHHCWLTFVVSLRALAFYATTRIDRALAEVMGRLCGSAGLDPEDGGRGVAN